MRFPVLLYHRVGLPVAGSEAATTLSPAKFAQQMRWLATRGFHGIRPEEFLAWRHGTGTLPPKPVLISFDDGYADNAEHAFPVLEQYKFGAAVYLVTRRLGARDDWAGWNGERSLLTLMTEDQVRHWAARGIEFGAHTRTHRDLTELTARELEQEVGGSRDDLLALLGRQAASFAYPYGMYNDRVCEAVRRYFELALTCDEGMADNGSDPLLMRRMIVNPGDTLIEFASKVLWGRNPIGRIRSRLRVRSRLRRLGLLPGHA